MTTFKEKVACTI